MSYLVSCSFLLIAGVSGTLSNLFAAAEPPSYWHYVEHLEGMDEADMGECIEWINADIATTEKRARAWIRSALNRKIIARCLRQLTRDRHLTSKYYLPDSILLNVEDCQVFLTLMVSVESLLLSL